MTRDREEALIYEALSQVETPEYDIQAALARERPKRPWVRSAVRRVVLLAAVCAVLAVSAGAVGSSLWEQLLPGMPEAAMSPVDVSQTSGDYILTIEDTAVDSSSILLLLSLARTDGGPVNPGAELDIFYYGDGFGAATLTPVVPAAPTEDDNVLFTCQEESAKTLCFEGSWRSEDGTKLYLTYSADRIDDRSYSGEYVLDVGMVAVWDAEKSAETHRLSLAPLAEVETLECIEPASKNGPPPDSASALLYAMRKREVSFPLPLDEQLPQYTLLGAASSSQGLHFVLTQGLSRQGEVLCTGADFFSIIDIRDGSRHRPHSFQFGSWEGEACSQINFTGRSKLTAADLPYLEAEVAYLYYTVLSDQPFSIRFSVDSYTPQVYPVEKALSIPNRRATEVVELRLSPLGILVVMENCYLEINQIPVTVRLRDGTAIPCHWTGGGEDEQGREFMRVRAGDWRNPRFLDPSQVESVILGDLEIPIP